MFSHAEKFVFTTTTELFHTDTRARASPGYASIAPPLGKEDARRRRSHVITEAYVPDLVDIVLGADALGYVEARPFRENEQQRTSTVYRRQVDDKPTSKDGP